MVIMVIMVIVVIVVMSRGRLSTSTSLQTKVDRFVPRGFVGQIRGGFTTRIDPMDVPLQALGDG